MTDRFTLDSSYRRPDAGRVVIAGSPLRLFRLTAGGVRVVEAIERGEPCPSGHARLTERLLDAGAIHPIVEASPWTPADVTVVIPAFGAAAAARLPALVDQLVTDGVAEIIVVDDASSPALVAPPGARLIRLNENCGPGAARNTGLVAVRTALVAFVDDDVRLDAGWLAPLLLALADDRVALVAPRVRSERGHGVLAAYERDRGPLDLGPDPARVAPGTRVSYVPAAVLVCRAAPLRDVGGFAASMRYGEDVDLVWRLVEAHSRARYEPAVEVGHRVRRDLGSWLRQRVGYGSSAAPLATRHPGALAPVRMSGWSAATWGLAATGGPAGLVGAVMVGGATAAALVRKLPDVPARESLRLALAGHWHAGRTLASAIGRAWWPIALVAALVSRRARRVALLALVGPALLDWAERRPQVDPVRYVGLRILDDTSYGWGVWQGALRERSADALLPAFGPWPPRGEAATG